MGWQRNVSFSVGLRCQRINHWCNFNGNRSFIHINDSAGLRASRWIYYAPIHCREPRIIAGWNLMTEIVSFFFESNLPRLRRNSRSLAISMFNAQLFMARTRTYGKYTKFVFVFVLFSATFSLGDSLIDSDYLCFSHAHGGRTETCTCTTTKQMPSYH